MVANIRWRVAGKTQFATVKSALMVANEKWEASYSLILMQFFFIDVKAYVLLLLFFFVEKRHFATLLLWRHNKNIPIR